MLSHRTVLAGVLCCLPLFPANLNLSDGERAALDRISADSLRGHLSFIASDLLEGRDTPSPGLDLAAEYIAAQFRRAGLKPAPNGSYFQEAKWNLADHDLEGFELTIDEGGKKTTVAKDNVRPNAHAALSLSDVEIVKLDPADASKWTASEVEGKAVLLATGTQGGRGGLRALMEARSVLTRLKPAVVMTTFSGPSSRLRNPEEAGRYPVLAIVDGGFRKISEGWKNGATGARLSVSSRAPKLTPVVLKNVIGVLPGSDPALKDTYVLVTAHYDHIGIRHGGTGDVINNGANDDGSGTVSVVEIASALARMPQAPKRTVVFMTYFGEEKGLLGSRWYGAHPVFPVAKTIADLNLEQLGRTDAPEGSTAGTAAVTGYAYSDIGKILHEVGAEFGIKIENDPHNEQFFARSDNQALADLGVPAHTIGAAYEFPDYHGVGDEWQKIDYDNMAKLDRMIAAAVLAIADNSKPPAWNSSNSAADKYRKAAEALTAQ
jgi:hypothetical protein